MIDGSERDRDRERERESSLIEWEKYLLILSPYYMYMCSKFNASSSMISVGGRL